MTLDELRRRRANDMLAVLDRQRPERIDSALTDPVTDPPLAGVPLLACSSRELAWLEAEVTLSPKQATRIFVVPRARTGIASRSSPSALAVTYATRYYLAATKATEARDVYVVYKGIDAGLRPAVG